MEYCFLTALLDGFPTLAVFTDKAVQRKIMQQNFGMVSNFEDAACEEGREQAGGKTREVLIHKDDDPIGRRARIIGNEDEE